MKRWLLLVFAIALLLVLTACGGDENSDPPTETDGSTEMEDENVDEGGETPPSGEEAEDNSDEGSSEDLLFVTIELMNSDGDAIGTAELSDEDNGVGVVLEVEELEAGPHGIHFHETGKCEAPDFESAGDHFNPTNASHGMDSPDGPHAGDLPNIEAGDDGTASEEFVAENVTLKTGEENSLLKEGGTALVIHASEDDGTTDPSGESGDRIACGVVTTE